MSPDATPLVASRCQLCGDPLTTWPCSASWDNEHRSSTYREAPVTGPIWSAKHWSPMLCIAGHLGDRKSIDILTRHGIHADHCGGWEVLAWPCPIAADTLNYIVEETP